jgi:aryl-alcohol dehydrogenase-like predicted oxidoreductase
MKQRALGDTGLRVPELGLALSSVARTGLFACPDLEVKEMIKRAIDRGASIFSVSPQDGEGRALPLLGQALQGESAQVVLRLGRSAQGHRRFDTDALRADLQDALAALKRASVDILLLDRPPVEDPTLASLCADFQKQGLLGAWGAWVDDAAKGKAVLAWPGCKALAFRLNVLERGLSELLGAAQQARAGVLITSPLAEGWLAGSRRKPGIFTLPVMGISGDQEAVMASRLDKVRFMAQGNTCLHQAALQWVLAHPSVSCVLPGARTPAQMEDAIAATSEAMDAKLFEAVNKA